MADTPASSSSLLEQLSKALHDLQSRRDASSGNKVQWEEIVEHFCDLDAMFKGKSADLEAKEKEFEQKEAETTSFIAERKAAVASREQEMLDRVQELKDVAVAAISAVASISASHQASAKPVNDGEDGDKLYKVSSSLSNKNLIDHPEDFPAGSMEIPRGVASIARPLPKLVQFCQQMDAAGLLNFIMENNKTLYDMRAELSVALESAVEPARLVLELLVGFHFPDETDQPEIDERDGTLISGMYKTGIVILEAFAAFLARVDADNILNNETKREAKEIACEWILKSKGAGEAANENNSLGAEVLLQLLATFRVASEFDEDERCKLFFAAAHHTQTPKLCHSLGLTEKMPDIIRQLISNGRQVDAVRFIHEFQLTESFPPVPLLKTFLKDLRRNSQGKSSTAEGSSNPKGQIDVNAQELAALRAVIGCVKEFNLETSYTLDPLQKRLEQLEKARPDKKRVGGRGDGDSNRNHYQASKKSKYKGGGGGPHKFRGPLIGGPGLIRKGPPAFSQSQWAVYPARQPNSVPLDYRIPDQSREQAYDHEAYYSRHWETVPAALYCPTGAPSYEGYNGSSGLKSSYPYM